jgi:regulation of enolase protein 1 (concanavalin A-like superfamily)
MHWKLDSLLELTTNPDTDYWQRTHYGDIVIGANDSMINHG